MFTPSGNFVTVVVAPDSMSSVSLAEEEMLHFCTEDDTPKMVKGVGGLVSLEKSGFLMFPHPVRGSIFVQAWMVDKEMIPKHSQILLSKSAVDALAIDLNSLCSKDATEVVPEMKFRCREPGGLMTHVVTSHSGDATECRIMADVPAPPGDLGNLVCVEFMDSTTAYLRPTLLKVAPVTGGGGQ